MDIKNAIKEGIKYSKYEKIENGIYDFKIVKVEFGETLKSKRKCINYYGEIQNKSGDWQESKLVDAVDNDDNIKFGISRLIKFIKYFRSATDAEIDNATTMEELIDIANRNIGKSIKIEFIKKIVSGHVIKEKVFIYE